MNPKVWNDLEQVGPVDNNIHEGDLKVAGLVPPFTLQIRQGGEWINFFPRLDDTTHQVEPEVIPVLPDTVLSPNVPLLDGTNRLPEPIMPLTVSAVLSFQARVAPFFLVMTNPQTNNGSDALASLFELSTIGLITGKHCHFHAVLIYTVNSTARGSRFTVNGPSFTTLAYRSWSGLTTTTETINYCDNWEQPAASSATSASSTTNIAFVEGICLPSANGNLVVECAVETGGTLTVLAGSYIYADQYFAAV